MVLTDNICKEIISDIEKCVTHIDRNGSKALYDDLVAKYCVLDSDFKNGLPTNGKATTIGSEFDYRKELKSIAAKLNMWLIAFPVQNGKCAVQNLLKEKTIDLIVRGEEILESEYHAAKDGFPFSYVSGPKFDAWMGEIKIFCERYLKKHPLYSSIVTTHSHYKKTSSSCEDMLGHLRVLTSDDEFFTNILVSTDTNMQLSKSDTIKEGTEKMSNKVFVVHGHDNTAKLEMARTLEKAGFKAIILHEQPSAGKTVIEKIELYTDVAFAVVLYTPCDLGRDKDEAADTEKTRARQNVVFEHGYLIGKLGRKFVVALVKQGVETPGDISGVVYIPMDNAGAWKMSLAKEMKGAGLTVDMNTFCY